ncbi:MULTISPECIES: CocE/NonD family hydrolase [Kordiimonas]|uniref:CocE/NonD family hydrolase n=1 Tax=Kordiimonas TaxID=288021 RepID=UPI00257CB79E|nr:CocE/NonD family hydrolase [Kordiimonas sp. UBA4487]
MVHIGKDTSPQELTVMQDVMITMRDGVRLATDVYLPSAFSDLKSGRWPVLMERTPYGKQGLNRSERSVAHPAPRPRTEIARYFARHGYVVVMQDCRGRYGSEGTFSKYLNEAEDGFDTMAWIVDQPWCDGKIGTFGVSYGAHTQISAACLNPPGLSAMFMDSGGFASAYHGGIRRGGAFELKQVTWAYKHALLSPKTAADPARKAALEAVRLTDWFHDMPWTPGHSPLSAAPEYEAYLFEQWQNGTYGPFWQRRGLSALGRYGDMPDIPVMVMGSWYDPYVATSITNYQGLREGRKSPVFLTMGPWTHGQRSFSYAGDVDFGDDAVFEHHFGMDYLDYRLHWFDRYLKGKADAMFDEHKPVSLFVMGGGSGDADASGRLSHGGRWLSFPDWPVGQGAPTAFFLTKGGSLRPQAPHGREAFEDYIYDPRQPTPTIGGAVTSGEPLMTGGAFDQREQDSFFGCTSPGRDLKDRPDVLSFETAPLEADIRVAGPIEARLWVASDCPDTDFTVKLVDVYPPGKDYPAGFAMNITDGILRARYRDDWEHPELMEAGRVYELTIELFATANLFRKGHRIRVDIASSNFPHFDLNPNTGEPEGNWTTTMRARNRIFMDETRPSHILLPISQGK